MVVSKGGPESTATQCRSVLGQVQPSVEAVVLAKAFAALSDPVRLHMLELIAATGEMCVCDLVEPLGRAQPTVSHHIRILREAGLVECERRGAWSWYRAVPGGLELLRAALADVIGGNRPAVAARS